MIGVECWTRINMLFGLFCFLLRYLFIYCAILAILCHFTKSDEVSCCRINVGTNLAGIVGNFMQIRQVACC